MPALDGYPNLLDVVKLQDFGRMDGIVDETISYNPELDLVPSAPIPGREYKTLVRVELPGGPNPQASFRYVNEGSRPRKGVYEPRTFGTSIVSPRATVDTATSVTGLAWQDVLAQQADDSLKSEMRGLCSEFYYGGKATFGHPKGFPGLLGTYDATNMVVDAGGTLANAASSAWLLRVGPMDVQWLWGDNGTFAFPTTPRMETVYDANGMPFDAGTLAFNAFPGLAVKSRHSIVRIKNLTTEPGKGLTDSLVARALKLFPMDKQPNLLLCSREQEYQLQVSRTFVVNAGPQANVGPTVGNVAPRPTESMALTLRATDSIRNDEPLTL